MGFQKILVAIDYSSLCQTVFAQALELAQANRGAIMLLHCLSSEMLGEITPPSGERGLYPQMVTTYENHHLIVERRIQQVQDLLRSYCEKSASQKVPTEFDYKVGEAGQMLCQTAENWGAELIVMGRRGRKGLTEALLGSASNYVLHHAPCSVLVIQGMDTEHPESLATGEMADG
ncbi:universal stress protein [Coleofasciculus sp. H7-2]|uniref:universal stress protein n=1 Tax=Coleofasciculus sp. H7-2 TaxID=3351545 RepID=UPI00366B751C